MPERKNPSARALEEMHPEEVEELAEFYRSFADVSRLRILRVLAKGEICVSDLTNELGMTQSAVSHQLKILKVNRLVKARRDGKQILYSLDDVHVHAILSYGIAHIWEDHV